MDFEQHKEALTEHYARMARLEPAWKRYAWDRVQEMAAQHPKWFGDMPQRLTAAMRSPSSSPCEPLVHSTPESTGPSAPGA